MAYTTVRAQMWNKERTASQFVEVRGAEKIGPDLVIHRTVKETDDSTAEAPKFAATGDWVVALRVAAITIAEGIETREEARAVARRLAPAVAVFKDAVVAERRAIMDVRYPL